MLNTPISAATRPVEGRTRRLPGLRLPLATILSALALILMFQGLGDSPASAAQISLTETLEVDFAGAGADVNPSVLAPMTGQSPRDSTKINGQAASESIYVMSDQGQIQRVDSLTGVATQVIGVPPGQFWKFNEGDNSPQDEFGRAYFISYQGKVIRVSPSQVEILADLGTNQAPASLRRTCCWQRPLLRDTSGNIYALGVSGIAKITPSGVVTRLAGGSWKDFEITHDGDFYVLGHSDQIQQVTAAGIVTLVANLRGVLPPPHFGQWNDLEISPGGNLLRTG